MNNFQGGDGTRYSGRDELEHMEKFMPNYNRSIVKKILKNMNAGSAILEFGAGIGTLATIYKDHTGVSPVCLEIDNDLKSVLTERGFRVFGGTDEVDEVFDGVYSSNVLEHIEDDVAALKKIRGLLKLGGHPLVLYVPAFQCLFSGMDEAVGHYRRYGKNELISKLNNASYTVTNVHFSDCIGFFTLLFVRLSGYNKLSGLGSPGSLIFYDKFIYPISCLFDLLGFRFLFGKNLLVRAVARNS